MILNKSSYTGVATCKMPPFVASKILLVLSFSLLSRAAASQDVTYGVRMPSFASTGQTSGPGTTGESGFASGPSQKGSLGLNVRGRIVGNSIFDFDEPSTNEADNNILDGLGQQPSGYSSTIMTGPVMTRRPSVVSGQRMISDNGMSSTSMDDRSRGSSPARLVNPTNPSVGEKSNQYSNIMSDRKVYRYISVHVPPPEPIIPSRNSPIYSTPKPETHYQIVFIKAPSASPQELQEIQLPPPPRMKTLVYVLLKKPDMNDFVKISKPPKAKPSKPEVFFIRYKGQKPQTQRDQGSMMMVAPNNFGNGNNGTGNSNIQTSALRTTSPAPRALGATGGTGLGQNASGYDDAEAEIADSDFSHDSFSDNQYSPSSFQRNNLNDQHVRSGFSYQPVGAQYGIVN